MKTFLLILVGMLFSSQILAQRENFEKAVLNDEREAIIKFGEQLMANGNASKIIYRRLAAAYRDKNLFEKSAEYLKKAYLLDSNDIKTSLSLGELYTTIGDDEAALDFLNKVSSIDSLNTYALSLQQKIYLSKGNLTSALKRASLICDIDSTNFANFRNLGNILFKMNLYKNAAAAFEKALVLNPNDIFSRVKFCNYLISSGKNEEAATVANEGLARINNPKSQNALILRRNLALIQYNQRNADSCISIVKKLWNDGDTTETYTYKLAGYCYFMKGFYDDAAENLKILYSRSPDGDSLQYQLPFTIAQSYFNLSQMKKAIGYSEVALKNITPLPDQIYNANLLIGQAYATDKNYKLAIQTLEEAIKVAPNKPIAYSILHHLYLDKGDSKKVTETLNRYISVMDRQILSGYKPSKDELEYYEACKKSRKKEAK